MSDTNPELDVDGSPAEPDRTLSSISHLFLSELRENMAPHTGPTPNERDLVSILGTGESGTVFASHALSTAATLLGEASRIGVLVVHGEAIEIYIVEAGSDAAFEVATTDAAPCDADTLEAILTELDNDVDQWVLALPDTNTPHARQLLRGSDRWILLAGSDHEHVVGGYRVLKTLCDRPGMCEHQPRVTLAVPDAADPSEADRAARKLLGVCRQFLDVDVQLAGDYGQPEPMWRSSEIFAAAWADPDQAAPALDRVVSLLTTSADSDSSAPPAETPMRIAPPAAPASDDSRPTPIPSIPSLAQPIPTAAKPEPVPAKRKAEPAAPIPMPAIDDVIDLPAGAEVVDVALSRSSDLATTPVVPPMLSAGRLAVAADGALVLVVAAAPGLVDLAKVGEAMAWATQNRQLLTMALNQYRISGDTPVRVRLLVAHSDAGADALRPIMGSSDVSVVAYRRLRWGNREGLLLDAA
jgi:hypothetical protein